MFVQQEIAGKASAHSASGRRQGVFDGRARMLRPFSSDDAARTSSPDRARGTHAVTAPGDAVLVRGEYRREWAWRALSEAGSLSYTRRGAAMSIRAFQVRGARIGPGESPEAAPGWAPRLLSRLAASRGASIKPEPPRTLAKDIRQARRSSSQLSIRAYTAGTSTLCSSLTPTSSPRPARLVAASRTAASEASA